MSFSLMKIVRGELGLSIVRTFAARAIAALGFLGLVIVVGQQFGPAGFGVLALAQSILLGSGMLAKGGMDNALVKVVGQSTAFSLSMDYLRLAMRRGLLVSIVAACTVFFLRGFAEAEFSSVGLSQVLIGVSLSIPAYVFSYILSGFFKGLRMPARACLLENGAIALYAGVILLFWFMFVDAPSISSIGYSYFCASLIVAAQGGIQLFFRVKMERPLAGHDVTEEKGIDKAAFLTTSSAFWASNMAGFMQKVLAIMLAGWLLSGVDLGLFKSAQQIGMLIAFTLLVINAVFPPRFARLYQAGNFQGLAHLSKLSAFLGLSVAFPLVCLCVVFPHWVLGFFGEGFPEAAALLRIIALAQLVNVSTGSVGFLLNMTGYERLMRNIAISCNAVGLLAFYAFISWLGPLGAAIALAFILVTQNLIALFYVWRVLGIWTLPCPNLLSLLGVKTLAAR